MSDPVGKVGYAAGNSKIYTIDRQKIELQQIEHTKRYVFFSFPYQFGKSRNAF